MSTRLEAQLQPLKKILGEHQERLAVVYVRQSSLQQVHDHQESTRLQYGLVERARALGWPEERILVIDDDLGKSGVSSEGRQGFQRLVAEVGLDHVGLILGLEMSRLARSNKDWHQLLEACALFGTLIADHNGVYDARQHNDRLLLGLGGMMSEAELHLLKQRMHQGKLNKAYRGELVLPLPSGYLRHPSGEVIFDPDEQVQEIIRLIFGKFEELGTLNAVLRYLVKHNIQLGVRARVRVTKGELQWRQPNRQTLQNLLKHPIYAGAYVYGRRQKDPRKQQPGQPSSGWGFTSRDKWHVLLKDQFPAYISWGQYERNLARLKANQARADEPGAVRDGPALLAGLLVCGKCGHRMAVIYGGSSQRHRYLCSRNATNYGMERCQSLAGTELDAFVSQCVLAALEPAALEISLAAATHLETERSELDQLWQKRLERAAYEAERAARHYRLLEPENRLVARQLAKEWEEKLTIQQQLQEDYQRFVHEQPRVLSAAEREMIRELAQNIPALWAASTTTLADKKEIVRQVIERIIVDVQEESERVQVALVWAGGLQTEGLVIRSVARLEQLSYFPMLCERVVSLAAEGLGAKTITQCLNEEGFVPAKGRGRFGRQGVRDLMRRLGLHSQRRHKQDQTELAEHEWWLPMLAETLGMPLTTLYNWVRRGWVNARQQEGNGRWIVWADEAEVERLKQQHARPLGYYTRRRWLGS